MSIFLNLFTKVKFWQFSEKQISRKIDRNSTVDSIELIEAAVEMLRLSLPLEHINKNNTFRKNFTEKEGGVPLI